MDEITEAQKGAGTHPDSHSNVASPPDSPRREPAPFTPEFVGEPLGSDQSFNEPTHEPPLGSMIYQKDSQDSEKLSSGSLLRTDED